VALRPGAPLGLRGPFGRGFRPRPGVRKPLLVGAGTGAAPIMPLAERLLAEGAFNALYACGREPMLVRLLEMALKARLRDVQLSLERLVKCGMGLCGSCVLGPYRVCADGPVFDLAMLTHPAVRAELGRIWRDECGRPVSLPERVS